MPLNATRPSMLVSKVVRRLRNRLVAPVRTIVSSTSETTAKPAADGGTTPGPRPAAGLRRRERRQQLELQRPPELAGAHRAEAVERDLEIALPVAHGLDRPPGEGGTDPRPRHLVGREAVVHAHEVAPAAGRWRQRSRPPSSRTRPLRRTRAPSP